MLDIICDFLFTDEGAVNPASVNAKKPGTSACENVGHHKPRGDVQASTKHSVH